MQVSGTDAGDPCKHPKISAASRKLVAAGAASGGNRPLTALSGDLRGKGALLAEGLTVSTVDGFVR